ncbi:MAG: hypothetical protein HYS07_09890, partial [Chlamydiae bacterium]|nr:hypothetical protein [Chlamydiota bacterium]MBI3277504.1 hypothetical protein [Chlamydiota bacterium]
MKFVQKLTSLLLCLSFISYDIQTSFCQMSEYPQLIGIQAIKKNYCSLQPSHFLDDLFLSSDIGEVTDQNLISGQPSVFLIEDIHCNSEVQKNVTRILQILKTQLEARSSRLEAKAETQLEARSS